MSDKGAIVSPYEIAEPVLIKAVTNLHPGVGRTGEIVDLPVQKDSFGFPIIYSSSIKGALKSAFWQTTVEERNTTKALFGPDPEDNETFTSAVAILDAFTAAFPVRSLEGVYAYATSPLLLARLRELLKIANVSQDFVDELTDLPINANTCYTSNDAAEQFTVAGLDKRLIINEELELQYETSKSNEILKLEGFLNIPSKRLILLNDDDALSAQGRSLIKVTRIAINRETKTVKTGALWTEEYVPWSTVFVTVFLYSRSSKPGNSLHNAEDVRQKVHELLNKTRNYLIVGGDETVGKGIVKLEFKT